MGLPKDYLVREYHMPSIRYHDTSFIIFQKWLKAKEELAFPAVHRCVEKLGPRIRQSTDAHHTDSECNYTNSTRNGKSSGEEHRKHRRRAKSLEKSKDHNNGVSAAAEEIDAGQDDQNNNALGHETVKLHIVESGSMKSAASSINSQLDIAAADDSPSHVVVDVHRPGSGTLVIKENELTKDDVPDFRRRRREPATSPDRGSRASDSSDRSALSEASSNRAMTLRRRFNRGAACSSLASTSSTDDPADDLVDYAVVDSARTVKIASMVDQRILRKSNEDEIRAHTNTIPKSQSFPVKAKHHQQISDTLRLHYVTQRVLASVLPRRDPRDPAIGRPHSEGQPGRQDKYEKEVISMLEQKHGKNYRVFDLESCISVITLERICELCKHIDKWLNSGQEKVVVLQDREDRQRLGVAIAAYLEYLDICASNFTPRNGGTSNEDLRAQNTIARNWLALDVFSMKKFLEDFIGPLRIPSHKRYLNYFSGLLSGKIKMNSSPLTLRYVSVESPPALLQYSRLSSQTEWISFIKIYEGLHCIYTSDIHIIPITTRQFLFEIGNLRLRGDILIRCYHVCPSENDFSRDARELLFAMQFHTCAITSNEVAFKKEDLDYAFEDTRFPKDHKVTLKFGQGAITDNGYVFQSPLIRTEPPNDLAKADSIENFDLSSSYHTQGPLDGSLYATILKSPKSPHFPHPLGNTSTPAQRDSFPQNLISPPPEFSNKQYDVIERRSVSSSTPAPSSVGTQRSTLRSHSQPRSDYSYVESRSGTSQSHYRDKYSSGTPNHYPSGTQHITIVETYHSGENTNNANYQNGGREYVRSPLTLSMDSGISSSGALNRPQPGSSVSPSSFPSQASPQEDRHRELDDILSDMLMTVQDIPDFSKSHKKTGQQKIVRSQSVIPSSGGYVLPATSATYDGETVKRSQSYGSHEANTAYLANERDVYDTSSTTTTLTPPPSESGRDTPTATACGYRSGSAASTLQHSRQVVLREHRETFVAGNNNAQHHHHQQQQQQQQQQHQRGGLIMDGQHQSQAYPQVVRTESVTISAVSEDDDIPYHAREHSQPFTYGNVPPNGQLELETTDPRMIKMQSGLSSPSLVRKTLGSSSQPLRKTSPRNDFEEMLRERREKVMSEKYSISDRPSTATVDRSFERSFSGSAGQANGYHPHYYGNESLKRSNTLDGFHRSNSTDGLSGQTWLQLQQQKLRAKKDQQLRDDRRYFEEVNYTEVRNRPLRSRANVQRYDGYASDTAAFADEVDYRRPLHVQTPYNARSPERNYNTITTTTTITKERPFVTVKRAHEQARQNLVGSPPLSPLSVLNASPNGQIAQAQNSNGLLSMAESSRNGHIRLTREESFSSYRSETDPELSIAGSPRPETPAFPVTPRTPYSLSSNGNVSPALPPKSPTSQRKDLYTGAQKGHLHEVVNQNDTISCYTSRRNSNTSNANSEPQEVAPHHVKFVRDSSKYWYKPSISREEAVALLRNATPGTFIVRDSTTFKNAFGLVVRVAHPPPGVQARSPGGDELVRHFLVEPTSRGVRLKGCANEPVFSSLSALVYQHSITPLALPCRLIIPDRDIQSLEIHSPAQKQLLTQGAACNVLYLFSCDTESLTGEEAVRKAVSQLYASKPLPTPTEVHFKVSQQGITLTDNTRQKFFRKHYSANMISFCGLDPDKRLWSIRAPEGEIPVNNKTIFAFVARRSASSTDNQCHVFCDLQTEQPASAIVVFANKTLPTEKIMNQNI